MKQVKISMKNQSMRFVFQLLGYLVTGEHPRKLNTIESLVTSEIMDLIFDKNNKAEIKIKLTYSQSLIIFKIISDVMTITETHYDIDLSDFNSQIEKQLFQESEIGFYILQKGLIE